MQSSSYRSPMRDAFHEDLDAISKTLIEMCQLSGKAMARATTALLTADLKLAEEIISDDEVIDNLRHDLDGRILNLMARQQPVARDLRALIASFRMSADLERMGDLAHHIAKIARMRYPASAVPTELSITLQEMGKVATLIIDKTTHILQSHDTGEAVQLEKDDDEMDKLHRQLFRILLDDSWPHGTETAIDMTLVGRYYERCADHAVAVAGSIYFLVTGE